MTLKPSHIVMGAVGAVVYTAVCIGASEELNDDIKDYLDKHETETVMGKVSAAGYYTYRYGLTLGKALASTAIIALTIDGAFSPFKSTN